MYKTNNTGAPWAMLVKYEKLSLLLWKLREITHLIQSCTVFSCDIHLSIKFVLSPWG